MMYFRPCTSREADPAGSILGRGSQGLQSPRAGAERAEGAQSSLCPHTGAAPGPTALPWTSSQWGLPEQGIILE